MAVPVGASAADTYVDRDTGSDANLSCALATPCATIQAGLNRSGPGDTVHVDNSGIPYSESRFLEEGRSIRADNFVEGDTGSVIVDGGGQAAIIVPAGESAGTIEGLLLRSTGTALALAGPATVTGNSFDSTAASSTGINVSTQGNVTIRDNVFGGNGVDRRFGINSADASPLITGNEFSDISNPVFLTAGEPVIAGNKIIGLHSTSGGGSLAGGINVANGTDTIVRGNLILPGIDAVAGIVIEQSAGTTRATLSRNLIFDQYWGVLVNDAAKVTLDGDVLAGGTVGLRAVDTGPASGGDITATNVTVFDNTTSFELVDTQLTLDSSIVGTAIVASGGSGTANCSISFSRGPFIGSGCAGFQTTADPSFVDTLPPSPTSYHLSSGSPMIDAGNPAPPAPGILDLDGGARAVAGDGTCPPIRDIGADEFVPASETDCTPPDTTITSGPTGLIADATPTFELAATEPGSSFQCRADDAAFGPCSGPGASHTTGVLTDGAHTLLVRATDANGNADPSPAERSFAVDTTAPETTIAKGPKKTVKTKKRAVTVRFRFDSNEVGESFECRLDDGDFAPCTSPSKDRVRKGRHSFRVRATDMLGNVERDPATRTFKVKHKPKKHG